MTAPRKTVCVPPGRADRKSLPDPPGDPVERPAGSPGPDGPHTRDASPGEGHHLVIRGLGKAFKVNGESATVLEGMDLAVPRGEFCCVFGPSGCGKTTLLNLVAGFLAPDSGTLTLDGRRVTRPGPDRCVVFQEDALFPWLTVRENVAFGLSARGVAGRAAEERILRFLDLVGLASYKDHLPREISGGMKQRVSLARVLVLEPRVLLMDEPFASLDAQTRREMQDLLAGLWTATGKTVLFVTHDVEEAVTLADRIVVLDSHPGRIREEILVPLSRPRDPDSPEFHQIMRRLRHTVSRPPGSPNPTSGG